MGIFLGLKKIKHIFEVRCEATSASMEMALNYPCGAKTSVVLESVCVCLFVSAQPLNRKIRWSSFDHQSNRRNEAEKN